MRELSAGVYNLLKSTKSQPMSVAALLSKVRTSDDELESNLSTMLQMVRGSKQYWFICQGEVKTMIREYGPPTIFLTLNMIHLTSPTICTRYHPTTTLVNCVQRIPYRFLENFHLSFVPFSKSSLKMVQYWVQWTITTGKRSIKPHTIVDM